MSDNVIDRAKALLNLPPCEECGGDHSSVMRTEIREMLADLVPELVDRLEFVEHEFEHERDRCGEHFEAWMTADAAVRELTAEIERLQALIGGGNYENPTVFKGYTAANHAVANFVEAPSRSLWGCTPAMVAQTAVDAYRKAVRDE